MFEHTSEDYGLRVIPGIGKHMEVEFLDLGINRVEDLQGKDPEDMYKSLMALRGRYIDKCVLYLFRCAVYFAENEERDPELLKWWHWKERQYP